MRLRQIVAALRESGGDTVAISEQEIVAALDKLCQAGLFVEPTSSTALAAFERLAASGQINARENTVVMLSGTGLKAATIVADLLKNRTERSI